MSSRKLSAISRRRFIGLAGGVGAAVAFGATGCGQLPEAAGKTLTSGLRLPEPFKVPLHIPRVLDPVSTGPDGDRYEVVETSREVEIIPGTRTTVWGYEGTFPGPTLHTRSGRGAVVRVANDLTVPTSTHLHGGLTPPDSDGYPTDVVVPSGYEPHNHSGHEEMAPPETWTYHDRAKDYKYPLRQPAATLWYHDHRMDFSAPQVYRGLAGFLLVHDDEEDSLPLPKDERDIPLMICDRAFEESGEFRYPALDPTLQRVPGVERAYMQGVQGDVTLVNGKPWPSLEVSATKYRFRILNASNARRYRLALNPGPRDGASFIQVGSDVGLLGRPINHETLTVTPAERFDVVVDFAKYPVGTRITLVNELESGAMHNVMQFHVVRQERDESRVPDKLANFTKLAEADAENTRRFDFRNYLESGGHKWTINGRTFTTTYVEAKPRLGSVERWRFTSDFHHPVHLHLAHFQVVSRNGRQPGPMDAGWKDTVDVRPFETVDVLARFDGFRGRYMMHCHNLEHEDMAMMANFDVV
ncbi:spore coat protein A [Tamaricihabitans halophyticus]|uniref:Multicopper oxidase CueO n=1 Tax=Tamaricihabitans halophyticus TaxID=1262583 RepID=A0A4R2R228_9PSEU|nr:multicopper oxidase family protein [Tamaricihabitans halophyticus]TCP56780.1 spore coat protein A [Tamaricihabitans halophyticus]